MRFEINRELRGNETGVYALKVGWKREEDEDADDDAEGNQSHKWWPEMWTGESRFSVSVSVLSILAEPDAEYYPLHPASSIGRQDSASLPSL